MCLTTISKYLKNTEGKGWKVFTKNMYGGCITTTPRPTNKWIHENKFRPTYFNTETEPEYGYGFHIFKNKKDAKIWKMTKEVIKQVKYRNATVLGKQNIHRTCRIVSANVIVADEIFIIKN